jgi:hypothetical protein
LLENTPAATVVLTVAATDGDLGQNAVLTFSLMGNTGNFAIHGATGALTQTAPYDFETTRTVALTVLAQVASGRPVGAPYDGSRPHSITGDLDTTDADVAADVLLAQADGSAALLGAHVFTFHSATPSTLDAAPGIWLRVARHDAQTLSWALLSGLDDARYLAPVSAGDLPLGAPLGAASWLRLRLVVRGNRSVGYVSVDGGASLLLFSADVGAWAPRAGFFGVGTGSYTPNEAVFRSLSINAASTTCDAAPAEGAPVEVEMCQAGSAGQTFELWLPRDTAAGAFWDKKKDGIVSFGGEATARAAARRTGGRRLLER